MEDDQPNQRSEQLRSGQTWAHLYHPDLPGQSLWDFEVLLILGCFCFPPVFFVSMCRTIANLSVLIVFLDAVAASRHLHGDDGPRLANKQGDTFEDDRRWKSWPRRKQGFLMWERMKPDLDMIAHGEKLRCIFGRFFLDEHQLHPDRNWLHSRPSRPCQVGFSNHMIMFFFFPARPCSWPYVWCRWNHALGLRILPTNRQSGKGLRVARGFP